MKFVLLLLVFTFFIPCKAQELTGTYKRGDGGGHFDTGVDRIIFNKNGTFKVEEYTHTNSTTINGGNFSIKEDTLILKYTGTTNNNEFKIVKSRDLNIPLDSERRFFAEIQVFNNEGNAQEGVILTFKDSERKILLGFQSDPDGKFPQLGVYEGHINFLHFSWLGHQDLIVPVEDLMGKSTSIEITLKRSEVVIGNRNDTEKYKIKNRDQNTIELITIKGNNTPFVKWERVNKS